MKKNNSPQLRSDLIATKNQNKIENKPYRIFSEKSNSVLKKLLNLEYLLLNPDVAALQLDPLSHFETYGRTENRPVSLIFDKTHLLNSYAENYSQNNINHFTDAFFSIENHSKAPAKWIDLDYIKKNNPDYINSSPVEILDGILSCEIILIHPLFDEIFYREYAKKLNVDIHGPALIHYLHHGWRLGVEPHALFDSWYFQETSHPSGEKAPWLAYVESENQWTMAISPFVDEGYLNHKISRNENTRKVNCSPLAYALQCEDVSADFLHPHITTSLVDYLQSSESFFPPNLTETSPAAHLVELVSDLRLKKDNVDLPLTTPKVSVIIVNYRKPVLTLLSVLSVLNSLKDIEYEILLVDNDGSSFENELYYRYLGSLNNVRIIPTTKNLYFGEGNNIAIDLALGEYIWFLNNDAFTDALSANRLIDVLDKNKKVGAVGPVMFDANNNIGEAGGIVSPFGEVVQLAKGRKLDLVFCNKLERMGRKVVDYVSAANLLVRAEILRSHGGFDYSYEPFYYEDTDLCLRIKQAGFDVEVLGNAYCLHLENTSTREFLSDKFHATVARSREKFFSRWVMAEENTLPLCEPIGKARDSRYTLGIYTPFPITLGGGENYILSLAAAAAEFMHVTFITDVQTSITRFAFVLRDLGIMNFPFAIATRDECTSQEFDIAISMGNEIVPGWIPRARKFIYHCQFPFPINHSTRHAFGRNKVIDSYIVNSEFTRKSIIEQTSRYRLDPKRIDVISPPVNLSRLELPTLVAAKIQKTTTIRFTSVGRFFASGHCKRQDIIARVLQRVALKFDISAEIYGGLSTNIVDQEFFQAVKACEVPQKITVGANVGRDVIESAMENAHYYIHAAGLGVNSAVNPHQCEHFGITVVEAMANGCIPIVYSVGGPADIVRKAGVGFTFSSENELEQIITTLSLQGVASKNVIEQMALSYHAANEYSREKFHSKAKAVIEAALASVDS